jgi:hypothetical protein
MILGGNLQGGSGTVARGTGVAISRGHPGFSHFKRQCLDGGRTAGMPAVSWKSCSDRSDLHCLVFDAPPFFI